MACLLGNNFTASCELSQQGDSSKSANKTELERNAFLLEGKVTCPTEPTPSRAA